MADSLSISEEYKIASIKFDIRGAVIEVTLNKYDPVLQKWSDIGRTIKYVGGAATSLISYVNTANFSTNSFNKQILQKLVTDGHIAGTVS